ncbi:hypothetical protein F4678DRAFT_132088 [Xylaria arbuscula]|nr:hypothetical protein F4678DRAFT_132088 [Xylaria arbuscula]
MISSIISYSLTTSSNLGSHRCGKSNDRLPSGVTMLGPGIVLDSVMIRSAAEEATCNRARTMMIQAAQRLLREAEAEFRDKLVAEICKITSSTERRLEAIRREFSQQLEKVSASEEAGRQAVDDGSYASGLHRAAADILKEYHVLEDEKLDDKKLNDVDPNEHDFITVQKPQNRSPAGSPSPPRSSIDSSSSLEEEQVQTSATSHHGSEEDLGHPNQIPFSTRSVDTSPPPKTAPTPIKLDTDSDSGENKNWILDNDDEDEDEDDLPLRRRRARFPMTHDTPRNSIYRYFSQTPRPLSSPDPARARERSRSPARASHHVFGLGSAKIHRRRSLIRPTASQPDYLITGNKITESEMRSEMRSEISSSSEAAPPRTPARKQPARKSASSPFTYNIKSIFKNQAGSLYSPEHRLV